MMERDACDGDEKMTTTTTTAAGSEEEADGSDRASCIIVAPYGEHYSHLVFPVKRSMTCCVLDGRDDSIYKRLSLEACEILNDLRSKQSLCDCVIRAEDGSEFAIHKVVLSATSSYFRALFTNGMDDMKKAVVEIKGIASSTMKLLIGIYIFGTCLRYLNKKIVITRKTKKKRVGVYAEGGDRLGEYSGPACRRRSISNARSC
jgi:hypothetical protein